jgi:hypothetical protein
MPASRTLLAAAAISIASLAFAAGFAGSTATVPPPPAPPIVNVNAWEKTVPASTIEVMPVRPASVEPALQATAQCNPWDISDIAMEEILRDMQRQGWRPPSQGEAVASVFSMGVDGISVDDANAAMPTDGAGRSMITVLRDEEAEQARTEQISLEQLIVDEPEARPPS